MRPELVDDEEPSHRVVVVDDDAVARLVLSRVLRRLGHEVHDAQNVAGGLATVAETMPDLVLSDFFLPDGTGDDLLAAIRSAGLGMPFVLVTGVAELALSRSLQGDSPQVAATLTKPVDSRAVANCLSAVLDSVA